MLVLKKLIKFLLAKKRGATLSLYSDVAIGSIRNMGDGVKISKGVSCSKLVSIGRFTSLNGPNTKLTAKIHGISIGNFCSIAPGVQIQEYYHKHSRITSYHIFRNIFTESIMNDIYSKGVIVIEVDVWIGANSIILSGVCIGRGSIIAAGSVVIKDVPRYSVFGGVPAKFIKSRFEDKTVIEYIEKLRWWEWDRKKLYEHKSLFSMDEKELLKEAHK